MQSDAISQAVLPGLAIALLSAVIGYVSAISIPGWFGLRDTSTAGMMAVAAGAIFICAFLFAPYYGVTSRAFNRILLSTGQTG